MTENIRVSTDLYGVLMVTIIVFLKRFKDVTVLVLARRISQKRKKENRPSVQNIFSKVERE